MKHSLKEKFIILSSLAIFLCPNFSLAESKSSKESETRFINPIYNFLFDFEQSLKKRSKEYGIVLDNNPESKYRFGIYGPKDTQDDQMDLLIKVTARSLRDTFSKTSLGKRVKEISEDLKVGFHKNESEKKSGFTLPFNKEKKTDKKEIYSVSFSLKGLKMNYMGTEIKTSCDFRDQTLQSSLTSERLKVWNSNIGLHGTYSRGGYYSFWAGISKEW